MIEINVVNAYMALEKIYDKEVSIESAYKIFKLKNKLKEYYDFHQDEEIKIFNKYGACFNDAGTVIFNNEEDRQKFNNEIISLGNLVVDINIDKIDFKLTEGIMLSAKDIEYLSYFINFI